MNRSLTARLRGHVPGELDGVGSAWTAPRPAWPLPGRRAWMRRRRDAELAEIVAHLAVLTTLGYSLPRAVQEIADHGRGAVVDELATVARCLRDGQPARAALRRWAGIAACDAAARVAAVAAGPHDDVPARLDELAAALRERAHDRRMVMLAAASHVVWLVSLLTAVVAVIAGMSRHLVIG